MIILYSILGTILSILFGALIIWLCNKYETFNSIFMLGLPILFGVFGIFVMFYIILDTILK